MKWLFVRQLSIRTGEGIGSDSKDAAGADEVEDCVQRS